MIDGQLEERLIVMSPPLLWVDKNDRFTNVNTECLLFQQFHAKIFQNFSFKPLLHLPTVQTIYIIKIATHKLHNI